MTYSQLMYVHLFTIVPCVVLGAILLLIKKGTSIHRSLGKVYMGLMLFTAILTLFMEAKVGARWLSHFGWIHLLSLLTIYTVPTAYFAVRRGDIKSHQRKMILLFAGAIILAGGFTFFPGRYLHSVFFG